MDSESFDASNAIVLLLTMISSNLVHLLELAFQVLGSEHHLPVSKITSVVKFLASRDDSLTPAMVDAVTAALDGKEVASINEVKGVLFPTEE